MPRQLLSARPRPVAAGGDAAVPARVPARARPWLASATRGLERAGSHLVVAFLALAVTSAALVEFEAPRVDAVIHRPFVAALAAAAVLAAVAAWARFRSHGGSQATLIVWAFAALAGVYSPHVLLEGGGPDPQHLMFGPASRLLFSLLLVAAIARVRVPVQLRTPGAVLVIAAFLVVVTDLILHSAWIATQYETDPRSVLRGVEWVAVAAQSVALVTIASRWRRERGRFLGALGLVSLVMLTSSGLFLLSAPWSLRWWVAHLGLLVASVVVVGTVLGQRARRGHLSGALDLDAASSVADLLVEEMRDGLGLVNERGVLVGWNPAAVRLTGWDRDEAAAQFPREPLEGVVELGGRPVRVRQILVQQFGRPVSATLFSDATTEVELMEENARLELIARQAEELEAAIQRKNELLGMAVHDLRTPIASIQGFAAVLRTRVDERLDDTEQLMLERIEHNSQRMLHLVNDLLGYSAVESGRLSLVFTEVDLVQVVREALPPMQALASEKEIRVEAELPAAPLPAYVDAGKFEQILVNLLTNAFKYSDRGTTVTIRLHVEGEDVQLSVVDQGQGIPEGELDRLFEPFSRTSVQPTEGERSTGLGLSIVRKVAEGHGGRVGVSSQVGRGSTFRVVLPRNLQVRERVEAGIA